MKFVKCCSIPVGFTVLYLFSNLIHAAESSLVSALAAGPIGFYSKNDRKMAFSMDAVAGTSEKNLSFLSVSSPGLYWALYEDAYIRNIDLSKSEVAGEFALDGYSENVFMAGERPAGAETIAHAYGDDFQEIADPSVMLIEADHKFNFVHEFKKENGCMQWFPLRYGDLRGTGASEFVFFANDYFGVFSPATKKVIFSARWRGSDELEPDLQENFLFEWAERGDIDLPRYLAASSVDKMVESPLPAWRSFAKVFFGDFNDDGVLDLIIWRKLFETTMQSDSAQGFYKKGEAFIHYQISEGTYKLQQTTPSQVQAWLATKNLTWQAGFPSKSLCPGQEGQLIPEMHDPLLNDPDVLH